MPDLPAALGYRMPAEWEPHEATWIAWPHERSDWPGKFAAIPWVYSEIVRHLQRSERVRILVNDAAMERQARRTLVRAAIDLAGVEFEAWDLERVVEMTAEYCRRKEDAKFEAAFAELEC